MQRREALSLLLGTPWLSQACKNQKPIPGEVRGASVGLGHYLRSRELFIEQAGTPAEHARVLIVGAGPSGLAAAWRLLRLGFEDFVVLDLEAQAGGTSAYGTDAVTPYPWGAHYVPVPSPENRAVVGFFDELGLLEKNAAGQLQGRERYLIREPEERLYYEGQWHEGLFPRAGASARDLQELARFEQAIEKLAQFRDAQGRPAFTLPMRRCSDAAEIIELDRISAADWLKQNGFSSQRLYWFVDYGCRDDYGLSAAHTSAWAMLFYHAARWRAPGLSSAFLSFPEGNGRLVRELVRIIGDRLRLSQLVTDIQLEGQGVNLAVFDPQQQSLRRYTAEQVILAVPKFITKRIFRPFREGQAAHLHEFQYSSWLVANLHLKRRPRSKGAPLSWDNVLYQSPSLGYVVATHQQLADYGPTVWTYYHALVADDAAAARNTLLALEHQQIAQTILAELAPAHFGLAPLIERLDVWKWGHAMVSPRPGFIWGNARRRAEQAVGGVHFAHSDLSGMALFEEAFDRGVKAAEAILQARGVRFAPLAD